MLRLVVWLLVLANAAYFAWSQGYLLPLGLAPVEQSEPQRLAGQVRPEAFRLLNGPKTASVPTPPAPQPAFAEAPQPAAVEPPAVAPAPAIETPHKDLPAAGLAAPSAAPAPPPAPIPAPETTPLASGKKSCWQASGFDEAQAESLRAALALQDVPVRWQLEEFRSGGRWIVYMGRYDNNEQLDRKKAELRELKVDFREVTAPGLSPGLALGTFSSEASAQQALQAVGRAGVRTAQVAQDRAESVNFTLKLPNATVGQRDAVAALAGKPLLACK